MRKLLPLALVGLAAGVALGLLIGWRVWPVSYTNTVPSQLRQDYQNEYILMVAAAYQVEGDLAAAEDRLVLLAPEAPAQVVVELAETMISQGGRSADIEMLVALADALGAATPSMHSYQEGQR
ncbi:MAG: hypothetical protein PVH62_03550 [Anaerolineae bacterium]|jgi:hypothetical protein